MSLLLTLTASLFAFSAMADGCPQLAGSYQCEVRDNDTGEVVDYEMIEVSQSLENGVTFYTLFDEGTNLTFVADGVERVEIEVDDLNENEIIYNKLTTKATCQDNQLELNLMLQMGLDKEMTEELAFNKAKEVVSLVDGGIQIEFESHLMYSDPMGGEEGFELKDSGTEFCRSI